MAKTPKQISQTAQVRKIDLHERLISHNRRYLEGCEAEIAHLQNLGKKHKRLLAMESRVLNAYIELAARTNKAIVELENDLAKLY